jgi:hypothetical protein
VSGRTNRARVVGCGRVLGMRVGGLYRTHHAHHGNTEHAHSSDECSPICRYPKHAITAFLIDLGAWPLDDCTLRWSSAEIRCTKNDAPAHPPQYSYLPSKVLNRWHMRLVYSRVRTHEDH